MLLQLIYEEKSGFADDDDNCHVTSAPSEKPNIVRKNRFNKRLHEFNEVTPREGLPIHESESKLCTAIWQSVVIQAMYDLAGKGGSVERKLVRAEASAWFAGGADDESDFEMVCEMANLQPLQVRKVAKTIRDGGVELTGSFNFKTIRKQYSNRVGVRKKNTVKI